MPNTQVKKHSAVLNGLFAQKLIYLHLLTLTPCLEKLYEQAEQAE